jgi:hypothetical protein
VRIVRVTFYFMVMARHTGARPSLPSVHLHLFFRRSETFSFELGMIHTGLNVLFDVIRWELMISNFQTDSDETVLQ